MKNSHYYPHSGGILGCHAYVDFQHTNYLLNVTICEKLSYAHKLQTISDAFSHIASRFLKVALAIKFALNWLAGPQCAHCETFSLPTMDFKPSVSFLGITRYLGDGFLPNLGELSLRRVPNFY